MSRKHPDRATIRVDGRAAATLPRNVIDALGLEVGRTWDEQTAGAVGHAVAFDKAMRDAMRRLNRRMLSRARLTSKLVGAGHEPAVVDAVLDRLAGLGLVDDEQLGRLLIDEATRRAPAGPALLAAKLRKAGLSESLAESLSAEAAPDAQRAVADAASLAQAKLRTMARLDPATRKRRLWGQLARRGFDHETIEAALNGLAGLETDE